MSLVPTEPPPSRWVFPDAAQADEHGIVAIGGDLEPGTLLAAYRTGLFPMPVNEELLGWWSPDPRGVLELDALRITKSMRRSARRYEVTTNRAFRRVMEACGDPDRPDGWITPGFVDAYERLHHLGWVHSVEVWDDDELVGGLYGVAIGGLFCGESMFHHATDASKVALMALVDRLQAQGAGLIDVQWQTDHLATLGVTTLPRDQYITRIARLVDMAQSAGL